MGNPGTDFRQTGSSEKLARMAHIFHLLGTDCRKNIDIILEQTWQILDGVCSLYNRIDEKEKSLIVWAGHNIPKDLENKFDFLKYVQVKDTRDIEEIDTIKVMPDINDVNPSEMGKALHDIITTMDSSLGENAGHFFIKELNNRLDDDNRNIINDMGVDLSIMQLEREVRDLEKTIAQKKEEEI